MFIFEIVVFALIVYVVLLLLLEATISKAQPDMANGVTLFVNHGDEVVSRKLYGFAYDNRLYISSNHWFRQWYYAVLKHPKINVEHDGEIKRYNVVPIEGDERTQIARMYKMGFVLRFMCGFAPRRFLRLDPQDDNDHA